MRFEGAPVRDEDRALVAARLEVLAPPAAVREVTRRPYLGALALLHPAFTSNVDARALGYVVSSLSGEDLATLNRAARSTSVLTRLGLTQPLEPALVDAATAALGEAAAAPLLIVLSMARSGRTREAATAALARVEGWPATVALLIRVDDTVPAVAALAVDAVDRRLVPARARDFIHAAPLLDQRDVAVRSTPVGARARARARELLLLDDPLCRAALEEGMRSEHASVRTSCRRFVLAEGSTEAAALTALRAALDDTSVRTRLWAATELVRATTAPAVARALVPRLAIDPSPYVRRCGVKAAQRIGMLEALNDLVIDPDMSVRATARQALGRAGGDEQRARARDVLRTPGASGDALRGALGALAEIGRPSDFAYVAPFLHDDRTRVAAEAVRALVGVHASGGLDAFADVLFDKLNDDSTVVALEAARGIRLLPRAAVDVEAVRARLTREGMPRRLRALLEAIADP